MRNDTEYLHYLETFRKEVCPDTISMDIHGSWMKGIISFSFGNTATRTVQHGTGILFARCAYPVDFKGHTIVKMPGNGLSAYCNAAKRFGIKKADCKLATSRSVVVSMVFVDKCVRRP